MTSPEVSIKPADFILGQGRGQFVTDTILAETTHGERNGFDDACALAAGTSGFDWSTWTREHDHVRSPWHEVNHQILVDAGSDGFVRSARAWLLGRAPA